MYMYVVILMNFNRVETKAYFTSLYFTFITLLYVALRCFALLYFTCGFIDVNQPLLGPLTCFSRVGHEKVLSPFLEHSEEHASV